MAPKKADPLKKQQKPIVCFLRLYGTAKKRMEGVCRKYSTDHNSVAMAGTLAEILRLEMQADVDVEVMKAATEARRLNIDPVATLRERIAQISP